jgi:L-fuconolactonase
MEVLDAQIHDLHPWRPWSEWSPEPDDDTKARIIGELAIASLDAVGVDGAVISPGLSVYDRWAELAAADYPERFIIQHTINGLSPTVQEDVATAVALPGVRALRVHLNDWRGGRGAEDLDRGLFKPFFDAARDVQVPVFCFMLGDAGHLAPIAERYPEIPLIVDHLGLVQGPVMQPGPEPFAQLPELLGLARYPNVAVKLCGADVLSREPYPHRDLWPYLHQVFDTFGADRLMWASDFTRMRMVRPGQAWLAWYADSLGYLMHSDEISQGDKAKIFGGTLRRWLKWPRYAQVARPSYR